MTPVVAQIVVPIVLSLVAAAFIINMIKAANKEERVFRWVLVVIVAMGLFITSIVITEFSLSKRIHGGMVVLNAEGREIGRVDHLTTVWNWDPLAKGTPVPYKSREIAVTLTTPVLTANPKVRTLALNVKVEVLGSPDSVVPYYDYAYRISGWQNEEHWVNYLLYEFQNSYSKQLAELYNPLDPQQQKAFRDMLESFINKDLQLARARLVAARFEYAK